MQRSCASSMPRFCGAAQWDPQTPLFDYVAAVAVRDRAIKRHVIARAGIADGDEVLDVGCGTGTLAAMAARAAPGMKVTGVDADAAILARARRRAAHARPEIWFDEGSSTALPYTDASFDVVLCTLMLHHLQDDDKRQTASELARVLRPDGRLVVADPGRPQDPLMRVAVLVTVQLLDGFANTALNVRGELPELLAAAGFRDAAPRTRMRTLTGTYEVLTLRRGEQELRGGSSAPRA